MPLRKGKCYTKVTKRPFVRKSKRRILNYIKVVPRTKIPKFHSGDAVGFNSGKYKFLVCLIVKDEIQLRDNTIESARMELMRNLERNIKGNFFLSVRAYPHHILREHSLGSVAGSDRMTTGMAHSFGKSMGVAARMKKKGKIFSIACNEQHIPKVRGFLSGVMPKLPGKLSITVQPLNISNQMN